MHRTRMVCVLVQAMCHVQWCICVATAVTHGCGPDGLWLQPLSHGCSPCHIRLQLARITLPCTPLLVCALHAPPPPPPTVDSAADSAAAVEAAAAAVEAARWRSMAFSAVAVDSTAAAAAVEVSIAALSTATTLYAIDRHRALHVLPLGALASAGEGATGAEAAGADAAGADAAGANGGAVTGAVAGAAWWHGDGPPALRATLTTLLPCAVHALAVLPPTPGAGGGVAPAVAVLAEVDSLRMLALG